MTTNEAPIRYCPSCGKPEHGSLACNTVSVTSVLFPPEAMTTPLDLLAERVMRKVPCPDEGEDVATNREGVHMEFGYRRFQDKPHEACTGTGTVLDRRWKALREALWKECLIASRRRGTRHDDSDQHTARCDCSGTGFVRRNRAEAAYNLWTTAKPIMRAEGWFLVPVEDGWEIWRSFKEGPGFHAVPKRQTGPEDALSAALLAHMDAQEAR